jgi:hypothetical protein
LDDKYFIDVVCGLASQPGCKLGIFVANRALSDYIGCRRFAKLEIGTVREEVRTKECGEGNRNRNAKNDIETFWSRRRSGCRPAHRSTQAERRTSILGLRGNFG